MDYNNDSILIAKTLASLDDLPFLILSKEFKITFCSSIALDKFSLTSEAVIDKNIIDVFDGIKLYLDIFQSTLESKQAKKLPNVQLLGKTNTTFNLLLTPAQDELLVFIKNNSDFQEDLNNQVVNKKEMFGNLIANICNNFNNILGAINGNSSLLRSSSEALADKAIKDEFFGYLDLIDKSVVRAADLISQLNSFSAKVNVSFTEVDLNEIIRNLYIGYLSRLDSVITVDAEILSTKSMIRADPSLIQTSLRDICENAVHAMTIMRGSKNSSLGGTLTLTVDHIETDKNYRSIHPKAIKSSYWCVTIADTGVGIKKELLKKIITPFFTEGKSTLNPDGLGLSVANNIIQDHGGFLEIDSEVEKGTKVSVFIPEHRNYEPKKEKLDLNNTSLKNSNSSIMAGMATALKAATKTDFVLIVDDDIIMRRVAEVVLEKAGYKVLVASDGEEAVSIYKEKHNTIAGVFLDNSMPNMSGIEAFFEMKKINPNIKALLISGHDGDNDEVKHAIANGMWGFVKKPYTMVDLNKKAKQLLGAP